LSIWLLLVGRVVLDLIMAGVEAQGVSELEQVYLLRQEPITPLLLVVEVVVAHTTQEQVVQEVTLYLAQLLLLVAVAVEETTKMA
jgi:hypothetical protein